MMSEHCLSQFYIHQSTIIHTKVMHPHAAKAVLQRVLTQCSLKLEIDEQGTKGQGQMERKG